ncbi:uncharacterized protein LDX57_012686 [Aspergillus melleus]|uniref:uncharacterized protein n=1 Tax=Aspergillus melleus TaxID=138277 RepID=UPI001E8EA895|nr:uncharacterized protein LDX57_012686 [Aspergillus melleus]KAH8435057.1 hypothetical protein LDX57_012686 [Aspergillus melleus]
MFFQLCIRAIGNGDDPNHRSHWGFIFYTPGEDYGDLYHVQVIDLPRLWYQADTRQAVNIKEQQAVGMCRIALLDTRLRAHAVQVIQGEPAPRDGKSRCQDWTVQVLISLEAEELVEPGTAETWSKRVGMKAKDLAEDCGNDWIVLCD